MKTQFQSTEKLRVRLPPFLNGTLWSYIIGTDIATIKVKCPDGTVLESGVGGVPAATFDADVHMWMLDLDTSYYTAHEDAATNEWKVYATSDDSSAVPQWAQYFWGDYVDDLNTLIGVSMGKWVIDTTTHQLVLSQWNGSSWVEFQRFNLFDQDGNPSSSKIYSRVPA